MTIVILTEPKNPPRSGPPSAHYEGGRGNLLAEALLAAGHAPVMWWDHPEGPLLACTPSVVVLRSSAAIQLDRAVALRHRGVPVINDPDEQRAAGDKRRQALVFAGAGVPHPRSADELLAAGAPPTTSVVRKPRRGSSGVGVELHDLGWAMRHGDEQVVVQEQVFGPELRVVVVLDRCVGWATKVLREGEFRGNLAQGATMHDAPCPSEVAERVAVNAVAAMGLDYGGVDLIMTVDGPCVVEVNAAPTLWGPSRDSTEEILGAMVALLEGAAQPQ